MPVGIQRRFPALAILQGELCGRQYTIPKEEEIVAGRPDSEDSESAGSGVGVREDRGLRWASVKCAAGWLISESTAAGLVEGVSSASGIRTMQRARSVAEFVRAQQSIPGGVNSPARAFGAVGGTPVFIARGEGAWLVDVDGERYVDYIGSWGPQILGHAHPAIISAVEDALRRGTSYGAPTIAETELAELVKEAFPSIELVRMVNSGTEATMSALRVARGFTGRDAIIKFAGCYHGHVDSLLVQAGSGALTHGHPSSPGIPRGCTQDTWVLEYNDAEAVERLFREHPDRFAAVILEPVVGNMGLVCPDPEFLQVLRACCDRYGTVLIFDEVMTGFRIAWGGAQELYGMRADMTTLGKILGGGLPVGAYGGRRDIMQKVSPLGPVYQAGTLSGNPIAMAAGIATLTTLRETQPYPQLAAYTQRLAQGLSEAASASGIMHTCPHVGSMFTFFFRAGPVRNLTDAKTCDTRQFAKFFHGMLNRGVYWACSQFEANFVSMAHGEAELQHTLKAARAVFTELAHAG
ncbi:MAG: glutamate-1-semialdehyde 2,1-aminomutase [Planctomycetaceae bacterium]|nr:MAG: glutamate-1-semialdehyde 2,1-aminomutase [Planctomycetaceae bacterium]